MSDLSGDALVESAERIANREEFAVFVKELMKNLRAHPEEWENSTLPQFIHGLAEFVENMESYYANVKADLDCNTPSWRIFADILLAARVCG